MGADPVAKWVRDHDLVISEEDEIPLPWAEDFDDRDKDDLDDEVEDVTGISDEEIEAHLEVGLTPRGMALPTHHVHQGDVMDVLPTLEPASVSCVVTSPPYWGLRDYGIPGRTWSDGWSGCLGLEPTLDLYIEHLVEVFKEVKRVLHPRGSLWLNLGDAYAGGGRHIEPIKYKPADASKPTRAKSKGMSGKNLLMIPTRVALALQADQWIVRQDNIWLKGLSLCKSYSGSVMPESVRDRTTWAHEHVFHLTLSENAFYDIDGFREPFAASTLRSVAEGYRGKGRKDYAGANVQDPSSVKTRVLEGMARRGSEAGAGRNLRNTWVIAKEPQKGAHFACFPTALPRLIIQLATSERGVCDTCLAPIERRRVKEPVPADVQAKFDAAREATVGDTGRKDGHTQRKPNYRRKVLRDEWERSCQCQSGTKPAVVMDPFSGSGRAGIAALQLGRSYVGIELNSDYVRMSEDGLATAINNG